MYFHAMDSFEQIPSRLSICTKSSKLLHASGELFYGPILLILFSYAAKAKISSFE